MKITDKAELAELLRKVTEVRIEINHCPKVKGFTQKVSPQSVLTLIEKTKVKSISAKLDAGNTGEADHSVIIVDKIEGDGLEQ